METKEPFVEIIRIEDNSLYGTFGALRIDGKVFCVTLELSYRDNEKFISCIPTGEYRCKKITIEKDGKPFTTFIILGVPNRDSVLFHAGNWVKDTNGCVIVAQYWGKLCGDRAVLNSGKTFDAFMQRMHLIDEFPLKVIKI